MWHGAPSCRGGVPTALRITCQPCSREAGGGGHMRHEMKLPHAAGPDTRLVTPTSR